MARTITYTYTDDLPGLTVATDESVEAKSLPESQRVTITMTQGSNVYICETRQDSPLAATLRRSGVKQAKRGRKSAS